MKFSIALAVFSFFTGMAWMRLQIFQSTHLKICELVAEKSLFQNMSVDDWHRGCVTSKSKLNFYNSKNDILDLWQDLLDQVGVSHLNVYGPVEDKLLWEGRHQEVGLRVWGINGQIIVSEVLTGSPAEQAGVQIGDVVVIAGGRAALTKEQVVGGQGEYVFKRGDENLVLNLEPKEISVDRKPQVKLLDEKTGILRITSFRSNYFEKESWKKTAEELQSFKKIVIDLRGNSGGNFVAMLRVLSFFACEAADMGRLVLPRKEKGEIAPFEDNIADLYQIGHIENSKEVPLKSYSDYGCFSGKVALVVDERTASVSEMFSSALRDARSAVVVGRQTMGNVVVAIWYGIPSLGEGYSISIPEAVFESSTGFALEGVGVEVDVPGIYRIEDALAGKDSWISQALENF